MKKHLMAFVFICLMFTTNAQEASKYNLTNVNNKFGLAVLEIADEYLSPLIYTGFGLKYEHSQSRFLLKDNDRFSTTGKVNILAGITLNPENTSSITYMGFSYKWGVNYRYNINDAFDLFGGANVGVEYGLKQNSRNVNNSVNIDMATDLSLSGLLRYKFFINRKALLLSCFLETPVIGCMFVPESGASYYEISELGNLDNSFHFSSLHNKNGLNSQINIQIPFKHSEWIFGVGSSVLKYKANNLLFKTATYYLNVGMRYDLCVFRGTKNRAPEKYRNAGL